MKEYRIFGMVLLLGILVVPLVYAALTITPSDLKFGGSGFEKTKNAIQQAVTLKNDNSNVAVLSVTSEVASQNSFNTANINVNLPKQTLNPSEQITVAVDVKPEDFDAVDSDLKERGEIIIAKLKLKGTENLTNATVESEIPLKLEIENNLEIEGIELTDEDGNTNTVSSGSSYDITEDEEITLKIKVKNSFGSNGLDMQNIEVTVDSNDLGINEKKDVSDLNPGDTEEVEVDVSTDEIKEGDIDILLEGEDELGGAHGEKLTFKFDVQEKAQEEENNDPVNEAGDDSDGDGVGDVIDLCPNTLGSCTVDSGGCPRDSDNDGLCDDIDQTPNGNENSQQEENNQEAVNRLSAQNNENTEETEANEKEAASFNEETAGVIPFLIGLVIGICLTAGFFWLIKS